MKRAATGERGQAAVEFALSAVVILLLMVAVFDLGRVFISDTGLHDAVREGARAGAWFDSASGTNANLDDADIKRAVDQNLAGTGLPASVFKARCPVPADGNSQHNPPFAASDFPPDTQLGVPWLFICYNALASAYPSQPAAPAVAGSIGDLEVILTLSSGVVTGFGTTALGPSVHVVATQHFPVQGT